MTDNQILHEAMGFHICSIKFKSTDVQGGSGDGYYYCECGKTFDDYLIESTPEYTEDPHNGRLMDWLRGYPRCEFFDLYLIDKNGGNEVNYWLQITRAQQVALIAEAIRENILK